MIYHELAYNSRRQVDVARAYSLTQCRISTIARKVRAWVEQVLVGGHAKNRKPGERLHLAIARERIRLLESIDPLLEALTDDSGDVRYVRRAVAVQNGRPVTTIEVSNALPPRLMEHTMDISDRLGDLERVANLGPLADLPALYFQQPAAELAARPAPVKTPFKQPAKTQILEVQVGQSGPPQATIPIENQGRGVLLAPPPLAAMPPLSPTLSATCAAPPAAG